MIRGIVRSRWFPWLLAPCAAITGACGSADGKGDGDGVVARRPTPLAAAAPFTHRINVFLMQQIEFCVAGASCTSGNPDDCFSFYDGAGNVVVSYDADSLETLEPDAPVPPGGHCSRGAITDADFAQLRQRVVQFRDEIAEWTGGALDLELVIHEYPELRRVRMGTAGRGFWMDPGSIDDLADPLLDTATDFVMVVNAASDPATGARFDLGACGLSLPFEHALAGAGFSWVALECSDPLVMQHEWLHQVEDGLFRLSPYVDLYNGQYPACGQGDPDPTRWFPFTHDWQLDPDFPGCGTDGFPRFEEHQLRVHWSPDKVLITNHCKDGVQDFGETAVDSGGRCRQAPDAVLGCLHGAQRVDIRDRTRVSASIGAGALGLGSDARIDGDASVDGSAFMAVRSRIAGTLAIEGNLTQQAGASVGSIQREPVTLASIPTATFVTGSGFQEIPNNATRTLAPGNYGHMTIRSGAQVTFATGTYNFASLRVEPRARLSLAAPLSLNVQGDLEFGSGVRVTTPDPRQVALYSNGSSVHLQDDVVLPASITAPNAEIALHQRIRVTGCLAGRELNIGPDNTISPLPQ